MDVHASPLDSPRGDESSCVYQLAFEVKRPSMTSEHHITFGPFRLETSQARLWRGEQAIPLRPRTGAVLRYLATHPRRLVTKTELLQHVWTGTQVTDTVLRVCIREIRTVLEDAVEAP